MVATTAVPYADRVAFGGASCFGPQLSISSGERSLFNERFAKLIRGHWLDSIGNSIIVSKGSEEETELIAVLTPLIDHHPEARDRVLTIRYVKLRSWRCGNASLEWADERQQRLVWVTDDGRRSVWSRTVAEPETPEVGGANGSSGGSAFPWRLNHAPPEPWLPLDVPRDILYDGARVAALLDIRQLIGPRSEPQERLTHILMDHDLHPMRGDYLIPGAESPMWQTLKVSDSVIRSIAQRIHRIPHEALSQRVCWSGESEVWVGHHKISCRARDIQTLKSRWVLPPNDERRPLEIARLLALYSVFDNPLSNRRSGVHLGLDPELRRQCGYELFASPLNAAVPNGRFASKWPHVEWRFGSIGAYPSVLSYLPINSVVCVNPPFTEAYLADVMARLAELKLRYRLRIAVPIQEVPWRKKLQSSLPSAQLLKTYYDASIEKETDVLHPTLLWEDPRCPIREQQSDQTSDALVSLANHGVCMNGTGSLQTAMLLPAAVVAGLAPNADGMVTWDPGLEHDTTGGAFKLDGLQATRSPAAWHGCFRSLLPPKAAGCEVPAAIPNANATAAAVLEQAIRSVSGPGPFQQQLPLQKDEAQEEMAMQHAVNLDGGLPQMGAATAMAVLPPSAAVTAVGAAPVPAVAAPQMLPMTAAPRRPAPALAPTLAPTLAPAAMRGFADASNEVPRRAADGQPLQQRDAVELPLRNHQHRVPRRSGEGLPMRRSEEKAPQPARQELPTGLGGLSLDVTEWPALSMAKDPGSRKPPRVKK